MIFSFFHVHGLEARPSEPKNMDPENGKIRVCTELENLDFVMLSRFELCLTFEYLP